MNQRVFREKRLHLLAADMTKHMPCKKIGPCVLGDNTQWNTAGRFRSGIAVLNIDRLIFKQIFQTIKNAVVVLYLNRRYHIAPVDIIFT